MSSRCALALGLALCGAVGGARETEPPPSPVPLRVVDSAPMTFADAGYFAWAGPPRCNEAGDLFFLLAPHQAPGSEAELPRPSRILKVEADGRRTLTFDPTSLGEFARSMAVATLSIATDESGDPLALVWVRTGDTSGHQYVVSFTAAGKYRSKLEIDPRELLVQQFEVFGTGDLLLRGRSGPGGQTRIAILSARTGSIQDVIDLHREEFAATAAFDHMVRGGDGRIYVATQAGDAIRVVSAFPDSPSEPFAHVREGSELVALPGEPRLSGLMASGGRLIAIYRESPDEAPQTARWWLAAYDDPAEFGSLRAVYGPVPGLPVCYVRRGSRDRFTFLNGRTIDVLSPD